MWQKLKWKSLIGKGIIGILALVAYGYIINRLLAFPYWNKVLDSVSISPFTVSACTILFMLWWLNLFSECKKWQYLMQPYYFLTFKNAFRQVLAGTVTAIGSPARIAEMGGRMALLPNQYRINAGVMTTIGGLMQNLIILIGGGFVLAWPNSSISTIIPLWNDVTLSYFIGSILILIVLFVIIKKVWAYKLRYYFLTLKKLSARVILLSLFWTVVRYLVYNVQLFFWMQLFGLNIEVADFLFYSPVYFMLITVIPSYVLIDMGIRGSVALLLFGVFESNDPIILAAVFAQWLSNVVIPTLMGSFVFLRYKEMKRHLT